MLFYLALYYQLNDSLICFLLTAELAKATGTSSNESSTSARCNIEERSVSNNLENQEDERDPEDDSEAEFNEDDLIDAEE